MTTAEKIIATLLGEGQVGDWFRDRWANVKELTGIGQDQFGMGKPEKGFKPKFGPINPRYRPVRRRPTTPDTWEIK